MSSIEKKVPGTAIAIEVRRKAPFSTDVLLWRDDTGRVLATVVAKGTYGLDQDISVLLDDPDPIRISDEYWDDGAARSLRFPSDLAPFKAASEVLVVGHIYANGQRHSGSSTARVAVETIDKLVEATPPRRFDRNGELQSGPPQQLFSLRYELAPGGKDTDNPVGIDPTELTPSGGRVLPQLAPAGMEVKLGDHVPLIGLGPVSRAWPARAVLLRPEDREWLADPLRQARPKGFDARYFSVAPADQRASEPFRADERLILEGLHPTHPRLVTNLAGIAPRLRSAAGMRPLPALVADTLFIDTDRQIVTLTFRAIVPLTDERLVVDLVAEGYGEDTNASDALEPEPTAELHRGTLLGAPPTLTALPFAKSVEPAARAPQQNDGALPFRAPSQFPHSPPPSSSTVLVVPPPPPLVRVPPIEAFRQGVPEPPRGERATVGQSLSREPLSTEDRRSGHAPERPTHSAPKDPFRNAFGGEPRGLRSSANGSEALRAAEETALESIRQTHNATVPPRDAHSASDAAIAAEPRAAGARGDQRVAARPTSNRRAIVDLLGFDSDVPKRLRRSKAHAALLTASTPARPPRGLDERAEEKEGDNLERRDVLRVLSFGRPLALTELQTSVDALFDDEDDFDIPLLLVEGEVRATFDEVETLRVAASVAKQIAGNDKRIQAALGVANEALSAVVPDAESAVAVCKQLEAATRDLSLPPRYLAERVDRALLGARAFKTRTILGAPRVRGELSLGRVSFPIYLTEAMAARAPLLPVFQGIALVELRPREDAAEANPDALVAVAFGRVLRARGQEYRG